MRLIASVCIFGPTIARVLLLAIALSGAASCTPTRGDTLCAASDAYSAASYGQAITEARRAADGAHGVELDRACYIEGMANLKLGRAQEAIALLSHVVDSSDHALAADACVGIGTAQITRGDYRAAGDSYTRAAGLLTGTERARATAIASRAYERAKPEIAQVPAATQIPPRTLTLAPIQRETVVVAPTPAKSLPESARNFAIQAGAFSDSKRANAALESLRERAKGTGLGEPRLIEKSRAGGAVVYVVQIGAFANRTIAAKAMRPFAKLAYTVEPYAQ